MLKNFWKVAIRNLLRHKAYSAINVVGLSLGMACCVLIALFVQDEMGYDAHHKKGDRIYQVLRETQAPNGEKRYSVGVSGALAPAIVQDFPEVEAATRIWRSGGKWVRSGDRIFQQAFALVDPEFFDVLTVPLIRGNRETVFQNPYSLVISESVARKYFGDADPIGQAMTVEDRYLGGEYQVTGVVEDSPRKSRLKFEFLTATVVDRGIVVFPWTGWTPHNSWRPVQALILLRDGADVNALSRKLPVFMENYLGGEVAAKNAYHLYPFTRIYLHLNADLDLNGIKRITNLYVLGCVGFFILIIACINFTNLATARSANRAREVGMRKVVGAFRTHLTLQFLGESISWLWTRIFWTRTKLICWQGEICLLTLLRTPYRLIC